jgi:hypothetical protein
MVGRKRVLPAGWGGSVGVDVVGDAVAEAVQASIYDACWAAETVELGGVLGRVVPGLAG